MTTWTKVVPQSGTSGAVAVAGVAVAGLAVVGRSQGGAPSDWTPVTPS